MIGILSDYLTTNISNSFLIPLVILFLYSKLIVPRIFDKKLQKHQKSLEKEVLTHERAHTKRVEAIDGIYDEMVNFHTNMKDLTKIMELEGEKDKEKKLEEAWKSARSFYSFYENNKIYLPKDLCEDIDSFYEKLAETMFSYSHRVVAKDVEKLTPDQQINYSKTQENAREIVREDMSDLREEIEDKCRKLIGYN